MTKNNYITITVKLFANLREFGSAKSELELPDGSTIKSILERYKIPQEGERLIILINRKRQSYNNTYEYPLKNGDLVAIFPLIGGG